MGGRAHRLGRRGGQQKQTAPTTTTVRYLDGRQTCTRGTGVCGRGSCRTPHARVQSEPRNEGAGPGSPLARSNRVRTAESLSRPPAGRQQARAPRTRTPDAIHGCTPPRPVTGRRGPSARRPDPGPAHPGNHHHPLARRSRRRTPRPGRQGAHPPSRCPAGAGLAGPVPRPDTARPRPARPDRGVQVRRVLGRGRGPHARGGCHRVRGGAGRPAPRRPVRDGQGVRWREGGRACHVRVWAARRPCPSAS